MNSILYNGKMRIENQTRVYAQKKMPFKNSISGLVPDRDSKSAHLGDFFQKYFMIDERAASQLRSGLQHSRLQQQRAGQTAGPSLTAGPFLTADWLAAGHEGGQDAHGGTQHPWRLQPHVEACGHIIRYVVLGLCNVLTVLYCRLTNESFIRFKKRKCSLKLIFDHD
jgi:hypothetical protein